MNANPFLRMNPLLRLNQVPQDEITQFEEIGFEVHKKPDGTKKAHWIRKMRLHLMYQAGLGTGEDYRDDLTAKGLAEVTLATFSRCSRSLMNGEPGQPGKAELDEMGLWFYHLCGWIGDDLPLRGDPPKAAAVAPMKRLRECFTRLADNLEAGGWKIPPRKPPPTNTRVFKVMKSWDPSMRKWLSSVEKPTLGLLLIFAVKHWLEQKKQESPPSRKELIKQLYKLCRITVGKGKGANIVSEWTFARALEAVGLTNLPLHI